MAHHADGDYVGRALRGDNQAFQTLVLKYSGAVFATIFSHLGRSPDSEDVAQEVFLQAYRSLPKLRSHDRFGSWIYGIARHVCKNWLRQKKGLEVYLNDMSDLAEAADTRLVDNGVDGTGGEEILLFVEALPLIYREVITLRYMEDYSYAEIAEILGISESAVNVRLIKARRMLRDRLEKVAR